MSSEGPEHRSAKARAVPVEQARTAWPESPAKPPGEGVPPASPTQRRMLFLDELDPGTSADRLTLVLRLDGPLEVSALQAALRGVERRHEVLRTVYERRAGEEVQVVRDVSVELRTLDLPEPCPDELNQLISAELGRPFDLRGGPVWGAVLARSRDSAHHLVLTVHHIAADERSAELLCTELTAGYAALLAPGGEPPQPPVQYGDYASWQRRRADGGDYRVQLAYWGGRLAAAPARLELPTDRPRPAVPSTRGGVVRSRIDARLAEAVRALARDRGVTPFTVLLASFQTLLHRYSGQPDILVGTPVSGRPLPEFERVIGPFANTVALRAAFRADLPFTELLAQVSTTTSDAFGHQDVPFEHVVAQLPRIGAGVRHAPFLQAMFVWSCAVRSVTSLGDATMTLLRGTDPGTPRHDLTLGVSEHGDGLELALEFDAELWDEASAARMLGHFRNLTGAAVKDAGQPVSTLPMLSAWEYELVTRAWQGPVAGYEGPRNLAEPLAERASADGDTVAVLFGDEQLTYRELDRRANRLAHQLRAMGTGRAQPVGVLLPYSTELVVAILGVVRAGASYLPLDPGQSRTRVATVVEDARAALVITDAAHSDRLAAEGAVVRIDADALAIAGRPEQAPEIASHPDDLAYVRYSRSPTGRPEGVMTSQRQAHDQVRRHIDRYGLTPTDTVLLTADATADVSVVEIFATLYAGARLVVAEPHGHRDPRYLHWLMAEHRVTYVHLAPTPLATLLAAGGDEPLPDLRVVQSVGQALPAALRDSFLGALDAALVGAYQPIGTAAVVAAGGCRADDGPSVPIGRSPTDVRRYVLDHRLRPQPIGVPGELYVAAAQLTSGYLGDPGLTTQRLVPDPFGVPGDRLYRTGDRVRLRAGGELDYLGRFEEPTEIRGLRVDLGAVEAALAEHPSVGRAVVVPREDQPSGPRLVAYLTPGGSLPPRADELRCHLEERLPGYPVPAAFVVQDSLPPLTGGRVDRVGMAAPEPESAAVERYEEPATETERMLAAIWAELLGVAAIGRNDDFFARGGHSLLALQAAGRARDALAVPVPLRLIFESPTVARLARQLTEGSLPGAALPRIEPSEDPVREVSAAEARLWFAARRSPAAYTLPVVCHLYGPLDLAALTGAVSSLADTHEALRTTFPPSTDGLPRRAVAESMDVPLRVVDVRHLGESARQRALQEVITTETGLPFDLGRGPLVRVSVIEVRDDEHVLALTVHRTVADGWSIRVLLEDLRSAYDALYEGDPVPRPRRRIGAGDYARWQNRLAGADYLDAELTHWRERLAGAPTELMVPTDRPRGDHIDSASAAHQFVLEPELATALGDLVAEEGCTPFMGVLAGYAALLGRYTASDDIVLAMPVADRGRPELEDVVGLLLNTVAIRVTVPGGRSFRQLLHAVRATTLAAYEHQHLPFEQLVDELGLDWQALTRYGVSMDPVPVGVIPFAGGVDLEPEPFDLEHSKAELHLTFEEAEDELAGWLVYQTGLFDPDRIARMAEHLLTLLGAVVAAPDAPMARLGILTAAERRALAPGRPAPADDEPGCLHALFADRVARWPDVIAVQDASRSGQHRATALTYRQLSARANQLAHHLLARGVRSGSLVGIGLGRGCDQAVAVLAVLMTGAAYVALDPKHAAARLDHVIQDSAAALLITDRSHAGVFAGRPLPTVLLDEEAALIASCSALTPKAAARVLPEDLAYLVYTSGSHGRPKGVATSHGAAACYLAGYLGHRFDLGPRDTVLQLASLAFDASVRDLLGPLITGARVVFLADDDSADAEAIVEVIERERVSCLLSVVPSLLRAVVAAAERRAAPGARLRLLLVAGDVLDLADCERARSAFSGRPAVVNQYGPTECTMTTTSAWVTADPGARGPAPIGLPVAGARLWVVDRYGDLAPVGVPGELWIGGSRLARGYHRRPQLTAESFVPDPFSGSPGARAYRTGELACWHADGTLRFLGRGDAPAEARERVAPAGRDGVLRALPGTANAASPAPRQNGPGAPLRLTGHGGSPSVAGAAFRGAARHPPQPALRLAAGSPGVLGQDTAPIRMLPGLPGSRRGRVAPAAIWKVGQRVDPPRAGTEETVAAIFDELLGAESELGGPVGRGDDSSPEAHSLLASRLAARIRQTFGRSVPLPVLFQARTVNALAAWLDSRDDADAAVGPLTPGQEFIWRTRVGKRTAAPTTSASAHGCPDRWTRWR